MTTTTPMCPKPPRHVRVPSAAVSDDAGVAWSCRVGRSLGFRGRAAIHPAQLLVIRDAFLPSADEVAAAEELLAALEDAAGDELGVAVLPDGRFADRAMVAAARETVALAAYRGAGVDTTAGSEA